MAVIVVNTIGKKRTSPASRIKSSKFFPSNRSWFVKSTNRIEVFSSIPTYAIRPIIATKDKEFPVIQSAVIAQTIPKGMRDNTMIVLLKVLKSKIKTAANRKTVTMITVSDLKKSKRFMLFPIKSWTSYAAILKL